MGAPIGNKNAAGKRGGKRKAFKPGSKREFFKHMDKVHSKIKGFKDKKGKYALSTDSNGVTRKYYY